MLIRTKNLFPGFFNYLNPVLSVLLVFCAQISIAQSKITENPSFKYFGFQAGANVSNMNFNLGSTAPDTHINLSWKTGFTFGFILQIPLAKKFSLQSEYSYVQRYGTDESIGVEYSSNYLSIPVLLNYQLSSRFKLFAGPQVELLIDASSTYQGINTKITHYVEERSLGITGGLEYDFKNSLFVSARYFQGLNNIGIFQRSTVKEFKYEVFDITAGIRF